MANKQNFVYNIIKIDEDYDNVDNQIRGVSLPFIFSLLIIFG